jgi:hypothetical protein
MELKLIPSIGKTLSTLQLRKQVASMMLPQSQ